MRVRWSIAAAEDLERVCDFIAETSPVSARRVAEIILEGIETLAEFPNRGRSGSVEHTRELIFAPLPFVSTKSTQT